MNLANKLTIFRIILVPFFLMFISLDMNVFKEAPLIALIIFVIASITDKLDGYIARSRNMITDFGKFMDPLADKLLVTAAFVSLIYINYIPSWVVVIIISREYAVTGLRTLAVSSGKVISASNYGKIKTVFQMVTLSLYLILLTIHSFIGSFNIESELRLFATVLLYSTLILTIASGLDYFYKNYEVFEFDK